MADYTKEERRRFQSYLKIHLKKNRQELPVPEQIEALEKRGRSKWWHLLVNVAAIIFFGYSFYYDITQLGQTFFIIIMIVFGINVGLILYQKKQITDLVRYLEWKQHRE